MKNTQAIDALGFVTLDVIQNVFTTEMTKIGEDLYINGIPRNERIVFEWFDQLRQRLLQRARTDIVDYLKNSPHVKEEIRQEREMAAQKDARMTWRERVEKNRGKNRKLEDSEAEG